MISTGQALLLKLASFAHWTFAGDSRLEKVHFAVRYTSASVTFLMFYGNSVTVDTELFVYLRGEEFNVR